MDANSSVNTVLSRKSSLTVCKLTEWHYRWLGKLRILKGVTYKLSRCGWYGGWDGEKKCVQEFGWKTAQTIEKCRFIPRLLNDDFQQHRLYISNGSRTINKELKCSAAYFKIPSQDSPGGTEEDYGQFSRDTRYPSRISSEKLTNTETTIKWEDIIKMDLRKKGDDQKWDVTVSNGDAFFSCHKVFLSSVLI